MPYQAHDSAARVLVVDDERVIREILGDFLTMEGYVVHTVEDGKQAVEELARSPYDLILSDLKMPTMDGLELLDRVRQLRTSVAMVIMTGFGTVETAIEAMKRGAYDYILKPFKIEEVASVVRRGLERQRLQTENFQLRTSVALYQVSEQLGATLDLESILGLLLTTALEETDADLATVWLPEGHGGPRGERGLAGVALGDELPVYREKVRKASPRLATPTDSTPTDATPAHLPNEQWTGELDFAAIEAQIRQDQPVLAHGAKAARFFRSPPSRPVTGFAALPMRVGDRTVGLLCVYAFGGGASFNEGQRRLLSILASRAAVAIDHSRLVVELVHTNDALSSANRQLQENVRQTIVGFAHALEESDRYTRGHSERVSSYSKLIAVGMALTEQDVERVVQAALLHDIGKIGIRYEKLNKPGKLTAEELAMFRAHPAKGKRILEPMAFLTDIIPGVYCHHEAYDGGGYPQGLSGRDIPLLGRVIAVGDAYDAMTSDRAYRRALAHDIACEELERCSGTQFDPDIVVVFLREIQRWRAEQLEAGNTIPS